MSINTLFDVCYNFWCPHMANAIAEVLSFMIEHIDYQDHFDWPFRGVETWP